MLYVSSFERMRAFRLPRSLVAAGLTALLLTAAMPHAAAASATVPPLGMPAGDIAALKSAGVSPGYASYWVGDWMATSGWGGFDRAMQTAKSQGVTPIVYWYYWGDSISPSCVDNGCNGRNRATWNALTDQLAAHLTSQLGGAPALIVLENEFNKGGITGTYAPTFDSYLEGIAKKLNAVSGVKLVLGFGNWGEDQWLKFPKSAAQCEYIGFQMMRASTKDTETSYRGAADRVGVLADYVSAKFQKPSILYDLALSSYPDARWETLQSETLDAIFSKVTSGASGLQGVVYRSLNDHYMDPSNYYGLAESHWGLKDDKGVAKPAYDTFLKYATGSGGDTPPPPPPPPAPTQNVPGSFEAEAMTATKGGRASDASASGGAAWNLWSNGEISTALVSDAPYDARISVVARGQPAGDVNPRMELRLDTTILASFDVPAGFAAYTADVTLPQGSSTLRIVYTNDGVVNGVDRNLLVDVASVGAPPPPPPPNGAPTAAFSFATDGLTAAFDGSGSSDPEGSALTYAWSFGDGSTATGATASHAYAETGTYRATLTVSDGSADSTGAADVSVKRPNRAPIAAFAATLSAFNLSVDATGSSDADGDALSYSWDFGDGSTGAGPSASHTYRAPGTYRVMLIVSDGLAGSSASKDIGVTQPNRAPIARIALSGAYDAYSFDAGNSTDADGDALSYAWTFGDGSTATGARASHTYASAGSYTAGLTVSDGRGLSSTATVQVSATKPVFGANFTGVKGNNYWVQSDVTANGPLAGVCAMVNGGACQALTHYSYGWAASFYVPTGAVVTFKAMSTSGASVTSGGYKWPDATPVSSTPPPPAPKATFTPYDGNTNWVQTKVGSSQSVKSVCASLNGGACKALTLRSWGAWAAGMSAPTGTKVVFQATLGDGSVVKSATYTWPVK